MKMSVIGASSYSVRNREISRILPYQPKNSDVVKKLGATMDEIIKHADQHIHLTPNQRISLDEFKSRMLGAITARTPRKSIDLWLSAQDGMIRSRLIVDTERSLQPFYEQMDKAIRKVVK